MNSNNDIIAYEVGDKVRLNNDDRLAVILIIKGVQVFVATIDDPTAYFATWTFITEITPEDERIIFNKKDGNYYRIFTSVDHEAAKKYIGQEVYFFDSKCTLDVMRKLTSITTHFYTTENHNWYNIAVCISSDITISPKKEYMSVKEIYAYNENRRHRVVAVSCRNDVWDIPEYWAFDEAYIDKIRFKSLKEDGSLTEPQEYLRELLSE